MSSSLRQKSFVQSYGVDAESLSRRRQFIGLGEKERETIIQLIPWIHETVDDIVKEFYDKQFAFPATRAFFQEIVEKEGVSLDALRQNLESAQVNYLKGLFEGARDGWGLEYFNGRLVIGAVHDKINLPMKWYLGSYMQFQEAIHDRLYKSFGNKKAPQMELAICKVFNYDIQAVVDSFVMSTFGSVGMSISEVSTSPGTDKTESLVQIKEDANTLLKQAEAIRDGNLADPCLGREIPGAIGETFFAMQQSLTVLIRQVVDIAKTLSGSSRDLASAVEQLTMSIKDIAEGTSKTASLVSTSTQDCEQASSTVSSLESHAGQIDDVVITISSIADQTKVLALNATIEAARAGEAGQGFNVVAREVKELANNTVTATQEIDSQVRSIQSGARESATAMTSLTDIFANISEMTNGLAAAVEEQNVVTDGTMQTAKSLEDLSNELWKVVDKFKVEDGANA